MFRSETILFLQALRSNELESSGIDTRSRTDDVHPIESVFGLRAVRQPHVLVAGEGPCELLILWFPSQDPAVMTLVLGRHFPVADIEVSPTHTRWSQCSRRRTGGCVDEPIAVE